MGDRQVRRELWIFYTEDPTVARWSRPQEFGVSRHTSYQQASAHVREPLAHVPLVLVWLTGEAYPPG